VGGRYVGRIEDSTAGAHFTYWKPRDTEIGAAHTAFREFEAAVKEERINGQGAVLVGAFTFNQKYQKEPELSVYEWKPMALPRMEVAPPLELITPVNETERAAREAELFGVAEPKNTPIPAVKPAMTADAPAPASPPPAPAPTPNSVANAPIEATGVVTPITDSSDFFDL
jgi:hypothetical protein